MDNDKQAVEKYGIAYEVFLEKTLYSSFDERIQSFEATYVGRYESSEEYAMEYFSKLPIPIEIAPYIDWSLAAFNLKLNEVYFFIGSDNMVYVFNFQG